MSKFLPQQGQHGLNRQSWENMKAEQDRKKIQLFHQQLYARHEDLRSIAFISHKIKIPGQL